MADSLVVSSSRGAVAKDVWVLDPSAAAEPAAPSRDETLVTARAWRGHGISPRAAENLFWMGRYAERAEDEVRSRVAARAVRCRVRARGVVIELDAATLDRLGADERESIARAVAELFASAGNPSLPSTIVALACVISTVASRGASGGRTTVAR